MRAGKDSRSPKAIDATAGNLPSIDLDGPRQVLREDFIRCAFSKSFFKNLRPSQGEPQIPELDRDRLSELAGRFNLTTPAGDPVRLRLGMFSDPTLSEKKGAPPHLVLFGTTSLADPLVPHGCFSVTIHPDSKGNGMRANLSAVYQKQNGAVKGFGVEVLRYLDREIYPLCDVTRDYLKADFVGRYLWAQLGYRFREDYWYKDSSRLADTLKPWDMARANVERFLAAHTETRGMKAADLITTGDRRIKSFSDLRDPIDFAELRHRDGVKVSVRPMYDLQSFGADALLEVGKAFMLADYNFSGSGAHVISKARTKFAPSAMPYYNAYRDLKR